MQNDYVLNKLIFELLTFKANICYDAAAFGDSLLFDMLHDHVLKKLKLDLLTPSPGAGGSVGKIFATLLLLM